MSPVLAGVLVAVGSLLCTALGLAAGALWRLGNKVGTFEAAVAAAQRSATDAQADAEKAERAAREAGARAEAAAQNAARDAAAAARGLYDSMQRTVKEFQDEVSDLKQKFSDMAGRLHVAHDLNETITRIDKRLLLIERDHAYNHGGPVGSQRFALAAPAEGDAAAGVEDGAPRPGGENGGKR